METWPPCSIGSGVQISPVDQSIHMVRGVRSGTNLSLFALLISAVRDSFMNHLLPHPCRCVPLRHGERPATPQCCEHRRLLTCRRPPYKPVCQEAPHVCAAKTLLGTAPFAAPLSRR